MRPKLKIGPLTQLQDARSSAAVGFDLISFSLERGHHKKLSAAMVWNIVNWIQGPQIILDLNADSLEELTASSKMFAADWVSLPLADWKLATSLEGSDAGIYLRADSSSSFEEVNYILSELDALGKKVVVELSIQDLNELSHYTSLSSQLFLHFPDKALLTQYLQSEEQLAYGLALGNEFREDADYLDYESIDDLIELLEERFPDA